MDINKKILHVVVYLLDRGFTTKDSRYIGSLAPSAQANGVFMFVFIWPIISKLQWIRVCTRTRLVSKHP